MLSWVRSWPLHFPVLADGFDRVKSLNDLERQLRKYLPQADYYLKKEKGRKAFDCDVNENLKESSLTNALQKFLYTTGLRFTARYLTNWFERRIIFLLP